MCTVRGTKARLVEQLCKRQQHMWLKIYIHQKKVKKKKENTNKNTWYFVRQLVKANDTMQNDAGGSAAMCFYVVYA